MGGHHAYAEPGAEARRRRSPVRGDNPPLVVQQPVIRFGSEREVSSSTSDGQLRSVSSLSGPSVAASG